MRRWGTAGRHFHFNRHGVLSKPGNKYRNRCQPEYLHRSRDDIPYWKKGYEFIENSLYFDPKKQRHYYSSSYGFCLSWQIYPPTLCSCSDSFSEEYL